MGAAAAAAAATVEEEEEEEEEFDVTSSAAALVWAKWRVTLAGEVIVKSLELATNDDVRLAGEAMANSLLEAMLGTMYDVTLAGEAVMAASVEGSAESILMLLRRALVVLDGGRILLSS